MYVDSYTLQILTKAANNRTWPPKQEYHFYLQDKSPLWFKAVNRIAGEKGRKRR